MSRTGGPPQPPRCSLARMIQEPPDLDEIKRQGWVEQGILVVSVDDPQLSPFERELIRQVGNSRFGRQK